MKKVILVLTTIVVISCSEKPKNEFSLTGKTEGIDNGTVLYMDNLLTKELMDSASIQNNAFTFNTKLPQTPLQVVLRTRDYSRYRFLWLENNSMTFDATKSDFINAIVAGSESEDLSQNLYREIDSLSREERIKKEMEFVKKNPNSIVSANILSVYSTTWGKDKTQELFGRFSIANRTSEYGKKITRYIELSKEPKIGDQFVDFEMADTKGNLKKLSELKGKIILLEFWASWCGPCREENPNLVKTYNKFKPKGFEIFAVSLDESNDRWRKAIEEDGLIWEHVSDLSGSDNTAGLMYSVNGIPDNFLVNEEGIIVARNLRGEKLREKLTELLN